MLKGERKGIEKKFYELCSQVVLGEGLELYDMDYLPGSHELRVYISDPETGTAVLDDCARVDRALSPFIEEESWMPESLTLEVSSPGMFRQLSSLNHFEQAIDERVMVQLKEKLAPVEDQALPKTWNGQKKIVGFLVASDEDSLKLRHDDNYEVQINYTQIKKANLEPKLN